MTTPLILHITDAHVTGSGVEIRRDDFKVKIPDITHPTREDVLALLLARLAERLINDGRKLDAVVFSGDAALGGELAGHKALYEIIIRNLEVVGIDASRIVATPGNHDVPKGEDPGSEERYKAFIDAWRSSGCITPWLDGVDSKNAVNSEMHRLVAEDQSWAIFPLNSANWSHTTSLLDPPLATIWDQIEGLLTASDNAEKAKLRKQLESLIRYDMARVSEDQLEVFRQLVDETPGPKDGPQVRIAAIHHHLRAPSMREEIKAFADFTNLELLWAALGERRIDIVLHGHKHEHAARHKLLAGPDGNRRRALIISGATFDARQEADAVRTLELKGLPWVPSVDLERFSIGRGGLDIKALERESFSLWRPTDAGEGSTVIHGTNLDEVYQRACEAAQSEANGTTLIVDLDLPTTEGKAVPIGYPAPASLEDQERERWFNELAGWWQLQHSRLEKRVPYHHGGRLYRYAGAFDQISRVKKILARKPSSRALAILIDPIRDFDPEGENEDFASFCSVQFRKREVGPKSFIVDVIAYYRAQEFRRWWPINIAELRALQLMVCDGTRILPGRITTMTAEARAFGRSPTEVSVPVIDRWLDQHPARLFLLATYLANGSKAETTDARQAVIDGWMQSIAEFEQAAEQFNQDGVPLAIEGLDALACYIDALEPTGELKRFAEVLKGVVNANRAYADTKQERTDFDRWGARPLLPELRELSAKLLGIAAS